MTYGNEESLRLLIPNYSTVFQEVFKVTDDKGVVSIVGGLQTTPAPKPNIWLNIFVSLIPTFLLITIIYFIYRSQMKMMNGQSGAFGDKSPAQIIKSDKKFSDVAGNKEPIEEISEIVDYLKNPKKYEESGARIL
ncbi:hypothetical protein [Mycoplasmopsis felis]|uniref:hypothetical protein n=1 Tax=Mycoplasmopsis felis TaxID=33923 RepID=UPI003A5C8152